MEIPKQDKILLFDKPFNWIHFKFVATKKYKKKNLWNLTYELKK